MNATIRANLTKVFEYLTALKNLATPIVRDLRAESTLLWWQADLPKSSGCWWYGTGAIPNAWLELQRQTLPAPPAVPEPLRPWLLNDGRDPLQPPTRRATLAETELAPTTDFQAWLRNAQMQRGLQRAEQTERESSALTFTLVEESSAHANGHSEITFEHDAQRLALWEQWCEQDWRDWAESARGKQRVNQLYDECFALYQRLQREGDQIELMLGDAVLVWQTAEHTLFRPLLVNSAELQFDAAYQRFVVLPTPNHAALELEGFMGLPGIKQKHLAEIEALAQKRGLDWRDTKTLVSLLREFLFTVDPNSALDFSRMISGAQLVPQAQLQVLHAPLLFVRRRIGTHWQNDFQQIITAIHSEQNIPSSLAALVATTPLSPTEAAREKWQALGQQLYFPLPANEEQKEIARRLAQHFGVAVQGPPGTGKSHTIVNLIAHLLAHGKRVLITSQTARALRVLGEMLQQRLPEIAALCVPVLESDMHARAELEAALAGIYERLAAFDFNRAESNLQETDTELQACRAELAQLQQELLTAAEAEHESVVIEGRAFKPAEVGQWLAERQAEHGWLPDEITAECEPPLTENELLRLQELQRKLAPEALVLLQQALPPLDLLPSAAQIQQESARIVAFEAGAAQRESQLRGWSLPEIPPADLEQKIALADRALRKLESFTASWLRRILQDVAYGGQPEEQWQNFARECRVQLRSLRAAEKALAHYAIRRPTVLNIKEARAEVTLLHEELSKNKNLSLRFRYGNGKNALRVFEAWRLNGNAPRTAEDLLVLLRYLDLEESKQKFSALWANTLRAVGGPTPSGEDEQMLKAIEDHLRNLEPVLGWNHTYLRALAAAVHEIKPYGPPAWQELEWLRNYRNGLVAYAEIVASAKLYDFSQQWSAYLREGLAQEHAHALWARLLEALEGRDAEAWEAARQELQRLNELLPQLRELEQLRDKLRAVAPRWLMQLEQHDEPVDTRQWQAAWEWRRIHTWYTQRRTHAAEATQARWRNLRAQEARLLEAFVAQNTWLQQARHVTAEQLPALYAWLKTARKLESGKYERQDREEAAQLLKQCRALIPVWIMPLERVIETFAPTEEKFDVIIVDESSQCPIFALSALFRAERVIVIGDDKQVSPEAEPLAPIRVRELIAQHLTALPQHSTALWGLDASLFDHAQLAFAASHQSLSLREHFRCAPEIISFSNEHFYDGKILPLRVPLPEERLEPAIVVEHVRQAQWEGERGAMINPKEAEAVVQKIVALCADERYAQRTMGVISLEGAAQAERIAEMLRTLLSAEELLRRRLLCGEARHFQGDERDVIFLTMVAAAAPQPEVLAERVAEQRFNVATSRARNQLWLFHSLALEDLSPRCMRYRLLEYCQRYQREAQARRSAQETFAHYGTPALVRELYQQLHAQGYRVTPEVQIGTHPLRLDLVIEGRQARLGLICEGKQWRGREHWEEEFERQLILERAGWSIERIYASAYYQQPEPALAALMQKLRERDIKPTLLPEALEEIFAD